MKEMSVKKQPDHGYLKKRRYDEIEIRDECTDDDDPGWISPV